jgi:hypothetical protein
LVNRIVGQNLFSIDLISYSYDIIYVTQTDHKVMYNCMNMALKWNYKRD